jgi:cell division initiation protein
MNTRLSALDVKKKEFEQKMRGYDAVEVRAYLDIVSQEIDTLTIEKAQAEHELSETKKRLEHYLSLEHTLERTLVGAQQTAIKMEEQARKEAELIQKEAELARQNVLQNITRELDRAQSELYRLRAEYDATLVRMRALMTGFSSFVDSIERDAKLDLSSPQSQPLPATGGSPIVESVAELSTSTPIESTSAPSGSKDFSL